MNWELTKGLVIVVIVAILLLIGRKFAHGAECFPTATAAESASPSGEVRWSRRYHGHHGTLCYRVGDRREVVPHEHGHPRQVDARPQPEHALAGAVPLPRQKPFDLTFRQMESDISLMKMKLLFGPVEPLLASAMPQSLVDRLHALDGQVAAGDTSPSPEVVSAKQPARRSMRRDGPATSR